MLRMVDKDQKKCGFASEDQSYLDSLKGSRLSQRDEKNFDKVEIIGNQFCEVLDNLPSMSEAKDIQEEKLSDKVKKYFEARVKAMFDDYSKDEMGEEPIAYHGKKMIKEAMKKYKCSDELLIEELKTIFYKVTNIPLSEPVHCEEEQEMM